MKRDDHAVNGEHGLRGYQYEFYEDAYWIWVDPNVSVTATMSSTAVNSYLLVYNQAGTEVARNDNKTTSTNDAGSRFRPGRAEAFSRSSPLPPLHRAALTL